MTPEELVALRRVNSVVPSPDGTWLAVAAQRLDEDKQKYVSDLWRVPTAGGEPVQLTSGKHNDTSPAFAHDGSLMFLSNRPTPEDDEEKRAQIWKFRPEGGDPVVLTDEALGVESFVVAKNADVFVVRTSLLTDVKDDDQRKTAKERAEKGPTAIRYSKMPVRFWDHWLPGHESHFAAYRKGERRPWFGHEDYRQSDLALSDDGQTLAVGRRSEERDDRLPDTILELWDIETLERTASKTEPGSWVSNFQFADGALYFMQVLRDGTRAPWRQVVRWEFGTDAWEVVVDAFEAMSLEGITADGMLVGTGDHEGTTPVWMFDPSNGQRTRLTSSAAAGSHSGISVFSRDGDAFVCGVRSTLMHAPEPFVVPLTADSAPEIPGNVSGWSTPEGVSIEEHRATSTDGEDVHYYLLGPDDDEPRPTLLWIHGGPMSSWGDIWHWRWNSLVPIARGYRVVLSNPRGSTGYGYDFRNGIWGNVWGAQCYEDLMAVTDQVEQRDDVAEDKIVAMGGSFGGYMTNWIGGMTDRFACLVSHAGIVSFETFHGITDNPAWWTGMFGMDPFEDLDELRLYSPISKIADWTSPTLVIHGQQDYRVPVGEALLLFEALQRYDVESELLVYPDENHWIMRPRNIVSWYDEFLQFTDDQLAGPRTNG